MGPWNPSPFSESLSPRNLYMKASGCLRCDFLWYCYFMPQFSERYRSILLFPILAYSITFCRSRPMSFCCEQKIPLIPLYKIFPELQPDIRGKSHIAAFCTCFSIKAAPDNSHTRNQLYPCTVFTKISLSPGRIVLSDRWFSSMIRSTLVGTSWRSSRDCPPASPHIR